mmetsp:Transcript_10957/g.15199  ORF Transcript_10957/g.15199 Transcript_10957/m.15199 type:complete len:99 (-) Transcript_10957:392-688(-)
MPDKKGKDQCARIAGQKLVMVKVYRSLRRIFGQHAWDAYVCSLQFRVVVFRIACQAAMKQNVRNVDTLCRTISNDDLKPSTGCIFYLIRNATSNLAAM